MRLLGALNRPQELKKSEHQPWNLTIWNSKIQSQYGRLAWSLLHQQPQNWRWLTTITTAPPDCLLYHCYRPHLNKPSSFILFFNPFTPRRRGSANPSTFWSILHQNSFIAEKNIRRPEVSREVDSIDFGLRALGDCVHERRQCTDQNSQVESQYAIFCQTVFFLTDLKCRCLAWKILEAFAGNSPQWCRSWWWGYIHKNKH